MKPRPIALSLFVAALVSGFPARASDLPVPATGFECRYTSMPIVVDGKADDAAWRYAQAIDHFYLPWLQDKARPAKAATTARLLWSRTHLYFLAELDDADLFADVTENDGRTWHNDVFELFFKPAADKPGYYEFQVNAAGTTMDMFIPRRTRDLFVKNIAADEFHWETKVVRRGTLNQRDDTDAGWTVEGRIPWRDFLPTGGRPAVDERWTFALCRYDYSIDEAKPELSTCAPLKTNDKPDFHFHKDYAALRFVGPEKIGVVRPVQPGEETASAGSPWKRLDRLRQSFGKVPSRVVGSPDPPPPFRAERVFPQLKLSNPIFVVNVPGSRRLLIIDQNSADGASRLYRTTDDPATGELETLFDFPPESIGFSIAFHPRFEENGYLYIGWNGPHDGKKKHSIVTRYTLERKPPFRLNPKSAREIISWPSNGHNGAAVTFGRDGMLYVTSGDGTSDSDTDVMGQGMDHLLSKLLRIDVDHPDEGRAYSVPDDNPFVGRKNIRPETWAYGFRNPWRITTDAVTGDIWVGNNGQDLWEQAYLVERGANYGWSVYEGGHLFYPQRKLGPTPHVKPTVEHPHSEFRSLTGGVVYYGKKYPQLKGTYIYGDHSTGKIWGARVEQGKLVWNEELADTTLHIAAFATNAEGELLVLDYQGGGKGGLYTLVPSPPDSHNLDFPRTLSESGLFASVAEHRPHAGLIPYSVNAPLWSDGAYKERFVYIPAVTGEGEEAQPTTINLKARRGWTLPDGTVAVKSFALETEEGNPDSRRWIETRFLTRQQGEWVGYSYAWNDDQTDAELVGAKGADRTFVVQAADGGVRKQTWHYPSRSECMVCHSRAAKYVLGLSSLQMNKTHDYGGVEAEQFEVLEMLGLVKANWYNDTRAALIEEYEAQGKTAAEAKKLAAKRGVRGGQRRPRPSTLLTRPPSESAHLVNPYDERADLTARARSYLHANCAQCHIGAGGGNSQIDLEFTTALDKMKLIGEPPLHHKFGMADARLVAPGAPDRSVLLHRISIRSAGQMPQLGTSLVDKRAVELFRQWILSLDAAE